MVNIWTNIGDKASADSSLIPAVMPYAGSRMLCRHHLLAGRHYLKGE